MLQTQSCHALDTELVLEYRGRDSEVLCCEGGRAKREAQSVAALWPYAPRV